MSGMDPVSFKVMLVEDQEGFRRGLAELLRSRFPSMVLDEAANGSEAMEKLKNFLPQLIFMDIKLPGQNGLEITKRIKALHPDINVIILTSYDFPEYREAARECGAYYAFFQRDHPRPIRFRMWWKNCGQNGNPDGCNLYDARKAGLK